VSRGAAIDGGNTRAGGVLPDLRRHVDAAQFGGKAPGVVVLFGSDGLSAGHRGDLPLT